MLGSGLWLDSNYSRFSPVPSFWLQARVRAAESGEAGLLVNEELPHDCEKRQRAGGRFDGMLVEFQMWEEEGHSETIADSRLGIVLQG